MNFQSKDFGKHSYIQDVINCLCTQPSIRLGKNGETIYNIDPSIQVDLKSDFDEAGKRLSMDEFNSIVSKYGLPTWSKIFKGDFSGYHQGLASKNKGNAFEVDFVNNFQEYQQDIEKILNLNPGELDDANVIQTGGSNTKRPLTKNGNKLTIGNPGEVGKAVCDVLVTSTCGEEYYLSLKSGPSVSFCNIGIKELFPEKSFKDFEKTGVFKTGNKNGVSGDDVLNMLGIDSTRFAEVFNKYSMQQKRSKSEKDKVDVKDIIKKEGFMDLLKSIIGYNFILVHELKNRIHTYKLMNEDDLNKFIGNLQEAYILYPVDGKAKRIDVVINTNTLKLNVEIRNKQGGIYPDQILCKYWIK